MKRKKFTLNKIKINPVKYRSIISILLVVVVIIAIPIVFGIMSNSKYKNINKESDSGNNGSKEVVGGEKITNLGLDFKNVKVYNEELKKVETVELEEYVKGVVSSEMPMAFEDDALIAQGVLARTFVINKIMNPCSKSKESGANICNTTHCQVYKPAKKNIESIGKDKELYSTKLNKAIEKTKGQVLAYKDIMIKYPQYFAISSGRTENGMDVFNIDVPYLKSVESKGEEESPKYKSEKNYSINEFINIINNQYKNSGLSVSNFKDSIEILNRNEGGSVKEIKLNNISITGIEFRKLFSLNSANFKIENKGNNINIYCNGYGHGVGMSQWGANAMAKSGESYKVILKHYFQGTDIISLDKARIEI